MSVCLEGMEDGEERGVGMTWAMMTSTRSISAT